MRLWLGALAVASLLVGGRSEGYDVSAGPPLCFDDSTRRHRPSQNQVLKILKRSDEDAGWPSQQLVSEVAAILLQEQLQFKVELVTTTFPTHQEYRLAAEGIIDASFEVWSGNKKKEEAAWASPPFGQGTAVIAGSHTAYPEEGIYVPRYVIDADPRTSYFQNLQNNEATQASYSQVVVAQGEAGADSQNICDSWNCTDLIWRPPYCGPVGVMDRCRAQLLHGSISWTQAQMEQQIANHKLNISVAYLGIRSLHKKVWEAHAERKPVLFQHYVPHEGILGIPSESFSRIHFLPTNDECLNSVTMDPLGGMNCDPLQASLQKVVSPKLASVPDALHFAKSLNFGEKEYAELFREWRAAEGTDKNLRVRTAACRWLTVVAGSQKWGSWIRYTKKSDFKIGVDGCWPAVYFQLALLLLLLGIDHIPRGIRKRRLKSIKKLQERVKREARESVLPEEMSVLVVKDRLSLHASRQKHGMMEHLDTLMNTSERGSCFSVRRALLRGKMGFMDVVRREEDFALPHGSKSLPLTTESSEMRQPLNSAWSMYCHFLINSVLEEVMWHSFMFALAAGTLASALQIFREEVIEVNAAAYPESKKNFEDMIQKLDDTMNAFKFLPLFLVIFFFTQESQRWLARLNRMFSLCGGIQNLCLILAGAYQGGVNAPRTRMEQRGVLFKFYRFLNAAHCLAYFNLDPRLGSDPRELLENLAIVGLLTKDEALRLLAVSPRMRDEILTWVELLWQDQVAAGVVSDTNSLRFIQNLCTLRGNMVDLQCFPDSYLPKMIEVVLIMVTHILLILILAAYPGKLASAGMCVHPWVILSTFLFFLSYASLLKVLRLLSKGPFVAKSDVVNVDSLLCDADTTSLHRLRAGFAQEAQEDPADVPEGDILKTGSLFFDYDTMAAPRLPSDHSSSTMTPSSKRNGGSAQDAKTNPAFIVDL